MKSDSFGRLIAGPVGSGKTTACILELLRRACQQDIGPDGFRHTRFAITRQTLSQLMMTVKKDIDDWLRDGAEFKVSEKTFYVSIGDVRSEWVLIPLETPEDQQRLLSMQLTGAWMSECIEQDVNLVAPLAARTGRYPNNDIVGLCTHKFLIADTNMPTEGSPWHTFMESPPASWQIFRQPSGLCVQAENLDWLNQTPETRALPVGSPVRLAQGRKYYELAAENTNPDWVRRYVHAEYGNDPSGTAVFRATFKRSFHVQPSIEVLPGRLLVVGQDFGRDPCSIITQLDARGRLLVLEEVMAEDCGLELHIQNALRPALYSERYSGCAVIIVGDPAGNAKDSIYETNSFDILHENGFAAIPAPTNEIGKRLAAVDRFLLEHRQGEPALVFDEEHCPMLVRAMDGGYRYAKTRQGVRKPTPDKTNGPWSHIADALQYACLGNSGEMRGKLVGWMTRTGRNRSRARARPQISARGWT